MAAAIMNDVFGRLEWDEELVCWLGGIDWPADLHTEVAIWTPDGDVIAGLQMAREGLDWLKSHEEQVRHRVTWEMVEVFNNAWRGEDDPMTAEAFFSQLELVRIGFIEDGSLLLSYDALDLFGGQLVDADFGPDRSFRGAHLVG
jgi:hypothetical protein